MLKKHHFVAGLRSVLKLKVECKRPQSYEDALKVAQDKEWKLKHQRELGMLASKPQVSLAASGDARRTYFGAFDNTSMPYDLGSHYGNVNHALYGTN